LSHSGTGISISNCADYQALTRGIDDGGGDRDELIDFQNPPDLREEPMKQSEIPAGYANDGGQTFFVEALYGQMNAFRAPTSL
jgi:hypothetical protein